ncbi:MAG TPA: ABC transporter permease [Stellaceae bacterium]|jgi:osmoprotectant transport system permease protein|nr:ABC transporter permease [Stellaceae bacterium]
MRWLRDPLLWLLPLLLFLLLGMPLLRPIFAAAFPTTTPPVYADDSFFALFLFHAEYVVLSSLAAAIIGVGLGIVATREWGTEFRPLLEALATIGQTFPPVAVLALAVPAFGYGPVPTMIALTLYGILPILKNTLAGLGSVPVAVREAGEAMGLTRFQLLRDVELPLAAPTILAGIRISVIINIGTAAIGSTVGAVTLGNPIIGGLVNGKVAYVLQGALVVGVFAIATDLLFERLDRRLRRFATRD